MTSMDPSASSTPGSYPASFAIDPPESVTNWRPLVQWIMALPHWIVIYLLNIAGQAVALISWFVILFTGALPESLAQFQGMRLRYTSRVLVYAGFLVEEYPPFTFALSGADPRDYARLQVDFAAELGNRNRLTTALRIILVIPHLIALALLAIAALVCTIIAFFAVLFTGRWPAGLREFVVGVHRWSTRVNAYFLLLTDLYPPFSLD